MKVKEILNELRKSSYESIVLSEPQILIDKKREVKTRISCIMYNFKAGSRRLDVFNKVLRLV